MISHRNSFLQLLAQTSDEPMLLEIVKAKGIHLIDKSGKRYIDLISGISVSNTGHRAPQVTNAIRKQISKYLHTMVYGEYVQQPQIQLSKALSAHLPAHLNNMYYVNSGSEAIEGALKLAKRYTGKHKIVAMRSAYHGSSHGALSLMDNPYFTNGYRPLLPEVYFAEFGQLESLSIIDKNTAAVVVETIQSEAGYRTAPPEFFRELSKICKENNCLIISDEIQSGMGRSGSMFAFQQYDFEPDILCLAKALGGGMPLGAFIANKEVMQVLANNPVLGHITTFGGHPVCCAAATANIKYIEQKRLIEGVNSKELLFRSQLDHPRIIKITGKGLMLAIHLESAEFMHKVVANCIKNGLIIDWFLHNESCLRISPPLIITDKEISKSCKIILNAIDEAS